MQATGSRTWSIALGGVLIVGIIGLLVLAFLPPFNLLQRLQGGSYTSLTADNPVASHQDGIQVVAAPDELDGSFGVRLNSVPQLNFLEGSAGDELRRAVESLPFTSSAVIVVEEPKAISAKRFF